MAASLSIGCVDYTFSPPGKQAPGQVEPSDAGLDTGEPIDTGEVVRISPSDGSTVVLATDPDVSWWGATTNPVRSE